MMPPGNGDVSLSSRRDPPLESQRGERANLAGGRSPAAALAIALLLSACARSTVSPVGAQAAPSNPAAPSAPCPAMAGAATNPAPPGATSSEASRVSPPARPSDVSSIDAILAALYGSVSGPPGPRDWDRVRSIFAPGGWVAPVEHRADGRTTARIMNLEAFIERASRNVAREGFYEKEIARRTDAFGSIVHVFSTYEARHSPDDPRPFRRGINSIQLLKDGDRYWVVSIYWDTERDGTPIPDSYLPH